MSHRLAEQTYYEILEVPPDASQQDIHTAYHHARATYSPDSPALYSMFTREEAKELMTLIEEAFSILSNQTKRKDYDRRLIESIGKSSTPLTMRDFGGDLPDFRAPEVEPPLAKTPASPAKTSLSSPLGSHSAQKATLPEGFARTRFSVYEIDPGFEEEIKLAKIFDGTFVQKIRLYKHVNLDQLSEETRIGRTYLTALEANDYKSLPAPVFVRGFVVQVAKILGLNDKLVADSYMSILKNATPKQ